MEASVEAKYASDHNQLIKCFTQEGTVIMVALSVATEVYVYTGGASPWDVNMEEG